MRITTRVLAATAPAGPALGGPGTPAQAGPRPDMRTGRSLPMPGDNRVVATVAGGCGTEEATAASRGPAGEITPTGRGPGSGRGAGRVAERAEPGGTHRVRPHCLSGGSSVVGRLVASHGAEHGSDAATGSPAGAAAPGSVTADGTPAAPAAGGTAPGHGSRGHGGA
ncbi:hypothetical protein [Streptomyces lycii]|uniref:Uncharacterized protein n=1 Tax=Streptomyces lycii TaxID=2654337 RepID=A0ABQ7FJQ9_9ACTN|nr:hypothetical protein [Streptomyces lycii]KAF4408599.1 hypothetical protein GCU69_12935 [Streptomyces lycii]